MYKKIIKSAAAGLIAASMLAASVVSIVPMSVSADLCVGESDFTNKGRPWHTFEEQPAKQRFELSYDGTYKIEILNPYGDSADGDSGANLQFRHRKIRIHKGHTYRIHWEVTAAISGELTTHIGSVDGEKSVWSNNSGDTPVQISAGINSFDDEFTAEEDIPSAEWAFCYGSDYTQQDDSCFPTGTILEFDNMSLECVTCPSVDPDDPSTFSQDTCNWNPNDTLGVVNRKNSGLENNFISVNQAGYFTNLSKKATLSDNAGSQENDIKATLSRSPMDFEVVDASGNTVYTGKTEYYGYDEDSKDNCHIIDFSDLKTPGTYSLRCGEYVSMPFKIGDDIYSEEGHNLLTNAMNYYYQNRSGIDIETSYITSRDDEKSSLAHVGGHYPKDEAYVQSRWMKSYSNTFDGDTEYAIDAFGGWYDAGKHSKNVVTGGISVWTLQNIYERTVNKGNTSKFADSSGTVVVPENDNGYPDILDETRFELDWMMNMVVSSDDPYWGRYEGLVYHRIQDHKRTELAVRPCDYQKEWDTTRIVKPPTFAATLNFTACAAQAARLWEPYDPDYAKQLLDAAKKSYKAYKNYNYKYTSTEAGSPTSFYAPMDQPVGGGAYGDVDIRDDAYWAACELFITTGDETCYDDIKNYSDAFKIKTVLEGGENTDSFSSFNWGNTASCGSLSLLLNQDKLTDSEVTMLEDSLIDAADSYVNMEESQGYGVPYKSAYFGDPVSIGPVLEIEGYEFGSNSFIINNAVIMAYAYDITADLTYLNGVTTAMDYLLGRNPLSFSYITGYGSYHLQNPCHRYWSNELDAEFPEAPDGILSGGPGSEMRDEYIGGLGFERGLTAPQRCYVDSVEAWSVNSISIDWNAPLVWVSSFLQDEASLLPYTKDKLVVKPTRITVCVGKTAKLRPEINGSAVEAEYKSSDDSVADVGADGTITGVSAGPAEITVTADGQSVTVKVTVNDSETTEPSEIYQVLTADTNPDDAANAEWGDVNVDGYVNVADVVTLNMLLINPEKHTVSGQGYVNANCAYDNYIDSFDSAILINYIAMILSYDELGKQS